MVWHDDKLILHAYIRLHPSIGRWTLSIKKCQCSESVPDTFVLFLQSLIRLFMKRQLKHHSKTAPSVRINSALNANSLYKPTQLHHSHRYKKIWSQHISALLNFVKRREQENTAKITDSCFKLKRDKSPEGDSNGHDMLVSGGAIIQA